MFDFCILLDYMNLLCLLHIKCRFYTGDNEGVIRYKSNMRGFLRDMVAKKGFGLYLYCPKGAPGDRDPRMGQLAGIAAVVLKCYKNSKEYSNVAEMENTDAATNRAIQAVAAVKMDIKQLVDRCSNPEDDKKQVDSQVEFVFGLLSPRLCFGSNVWLEVMSYLVKALPGGVPRSETIWRELRNLYRTTFLHEADAVVYLLLIGITLDVKLL